MEANEKDERARKNLEFYARDYKIFIDTCSLMHSTADMFWSNIIPYLQQYNNKVYIPLRCVQELEKHMTDEQQPERAAIARKAHMVVSRLWKANLVDIRGEQTDNFADNVFQVVFTKFRIQYKLLLITQDKNLARDIDSLNANKSVNGKRLHVRRINQYGFLTGLHINEETGRRPEKPFIPNNVNPAEIFKLCNNVTNITDSQIAVRYIPHEQDTVLSLGGSIQLGDKIAAGGEGIIYETNTPYVAKVYTKENLTRRRHEKIRLMLSKPVKCAGICCPVAAINNQYGEFVGYLMPKAKGKELQKSIFIKPLFLKNFPTWKKRDTVELCITILEKIKHLHDRNIIMGDINPANILVVSPKEVYFVDTDSYQIEDLPCPVGTNNYTAPEIQRKHFSSFLRTMGNENFAVATLLFMIMLPGKPPYSQQGGEDPISNIINMDFSYPFGESSNKKTPDGPWRYIWSHLTYDLKEAFYHTFRKDGNYSSEATRLNVNDWLKHFKNYLQLLDSGKFGEQDKMSEELFPIRHKKNRNLEYVRCSICGIEVAAGQCQAGICRECLNKGEVYRCSKCGKELLFTNYQKYVRQAKKRDICQECYEYGNKVRLHQTCTVCGTVFPITNNEYDFLASKKYEIPKRCKSCRSARNDNNRNTTHRGNSSSNTKDESIFDKFLDFIGW